MKLLLPAIQRPGSRSPNTTASKSTPSRLSTEIAAPPRWPGSSSRTQASSVLAASGTGIGGVST
jgi:hypothetical protein